MSRVLRRKLVRLGRSGLATAHEPSVVIRGLNVFVRAIDDIVEVEGNLMRDGLGMAAVGFAGEGEAEEG